MSKEIMEWTEKDWLDWLKETVSEIIHKPLSVSSKYPQEYRRILQVVGNWSMVESKMRRYLEGSYEPSTVLPYWLRGRETIGIVANGAWSGKRQQKESQSTSPTRVITDKSEVAELFRQLDLKSAMKEPHYIRGLVGGSDDKLQPMKTEQKGVDEMAKGRKVEQKPGWRSHDEVMASVMEVCEEQGRALSERALKKNQWLDREEIVAVLGKGSPSKAIEVITEEWAKRYPEKQKPQRPARAIEPKKPDVQELLHQKPMTEEERMFYDAHLKLGMPVEEVKLAYNGAMEDIRAMSCGVSVASVAGLKEAYGSMIDVDKIVKYVGFGDRVLADKRIADEWRRLYGEKVLAPEEVAPEEVAPEEVAPEEVAPEEVAPEAIVEPPKKRIRLKVTIASLYRMVREMQEYYGLAPDCYPSDAQVKAYSKEHRERCPSSVTFYNNLGPRANWTQKFKDEGLIESETPPETLEVDEVLVPEKVAEPTRVEASEKVKEAEAVLIGDRPATAEELAEILAHESPEQKSMDVLVKSVTLDVVIGGQNWKLNLKFGTE